MTPDPLARKRRVLFIVTVALVTSAVLVLTIPSSLPRVARLSVAFGDLFAAALMFVALRQMKR